MKSGRLERVGTIEEDCFVSPLINMANEKQNNENCFRRPNTKQELHREESMKVLKLSDLDIYQ